MASHTLSNKSCTRCNRKVAVSNTDPWGRCGLCQQTLGADPTQNRFAAWLKSKGAYRLLRCTSCLQTPVRTMDSSEELPAVAQCEACNHRSANLKLARKAKLEKRNGRNGHSFPKPTFVKPTPGPHVERIKDRYTLMTDEELALAAEEMMRRYTRLQTTLRNLGLKP